MTETWRFVDCGAVDAFQNHAQMSVLSRSAVDAAEPVLQTSEWGRTHLNVGWFDDVDDTLDLAACDRLGVQVIRRPFAGGGTAFYEAGSAVMWGVLFPKGSGHDDLDAQTEWSQTVVLAALDRLGLAGVRFRNADLRLADDRKLGGVSAGDFGRVVSVGGFLNVRRADLDVYLQVVRVPDDKFADKLVKDMRDYVCPADEVAGHPIDYDAFRDALLDAVAAAGVTVRAGPLTEAERGALEKISCRIGTDDTLRRVSSERFRAEHEPGGLRVGFANHKARKLCRAGLAIDSAGIVAAAMLAGDLHVAPPDTLDRAAAALVGTRADDIDDLRARLAAVYEAPEVHRAESTGVTTDDLLAAVTRAVTAAPEGARRR